MNDKCVGPNREIPRVFLIVTIPTHLRVMTDVADLLHDSGKFSPQMVYYPSEVFDRNHESLSKAPHCSYIWTSGTFLSAEQYQQQRMAQSEESRVHSLASAKRVRVPIFQRSIGQIFLTVYRQLWRLLLFPFRFLLRQSRFFKSVVSWIWRLCTELARGYGLLVMVGSTLIELSGDFLKKIINPKSVARRTLQDRFLLYFSKKWTSLPGLDQGTGAGNRLKNQSNEGLFVGLSEQKTFYHELTKLLERDKPTLIVLPEENIFYNSHLVVSAASYSGIPSVVVPFTIANTLEWAEAFYNLKGYQANRGWNRILARAFPKWVLHHRGRLLILPPTYILVCEYFDVVPDQPWVISSGPADAIAAESQFMCNYYLRAGIRAEKIRLTGSLSDDKLHRLLRSKDAHRAALSVRSGIALRRKIVLIGLPPDQFGGGVREGCEFENYEALVRYMVGTVAAQCSDATLLINLHPRIRRENVAYLEALGATIIVEPIEHLVPLADVYISVVSATIRLAIACGIPVINYDAYQYDYDDYKDLPGVLEVKTKESFFATTEALIKEATFYSKTREAQQATARSLCDIDGNAGVRMLALFEELSENRMDRRQVGALP